MTAESGNRGEPGEPDEPPAAALRARIARLEGQIATLESALDRRSQELVLLQSVLCRADLLQLARIADGLPPLPRIAHQPEYWTETTVISPANLEATLEDLWSSLSPRPADTPAAPRTATAAGTAAPTGPGA
ncbi:MAG: hypothetical protein QG573_2349 [Acidobacteriota bacterium]|nr:hypothetical protein [Acidobacteriota bacterium]